MPAKGKKSLPVAEDTHQKIRVAAAQTGKDMYVIVDEAFDLYAKSIANSGDPAIAQTGTARISSPDKEGPPLGEMPDGAVRSLAQHWGDAGFRECVMATSRVWDIGDAEIKDSLVRNCRTFARSSDMLEALIENVEHGKLPPEYERRAKELLSGSRRSPKAARGSKAPNAARDGGRT